MKYYLILGLQVQRYKGSIDISIHSDGILIDQLQIDHSINQHVPEYLWTSGGSQLSFNRKINKHYSDLVPLPELVNVDREKDIVMYAINMPEKMFMYEIDDSVLGSEITLTINDQNTNYTNGFMTKSNLFQLCFAMLIPKDFCHKNNWSRINKLFKKFQKYRTSVERNDGETFANTVHWPITRFCKIGDNQELIHKHWVGGNNKLVLTVYKKFGIYMLWGGTGRPRVRFNSDFVYVDRVFNLLNMLNEDQRSNHT